VDEAQAEELTIVESPEGKTMTGDHPGAKRKWWKWAIGLALLLGIGLVAKARHVSLENHRRFEAWREEAADRGLFVATVSYQGIVGIDLIPGAADFLSRDKAAVSVPTDAVAEILMDLRTPAPRGLILVDEGMTPEVAVRLAKHFPGASMAKLAAPPAKPAASGPPPGK